MEVDSVHLNKRSDPYEFEDDMTAPAVSMEGFKRTNSVKVCVVIHRNAVHSLVKSIFTLFEYCNCVCQLWHSCSENKFEKVSLLRLQQRHIVVNWGETR
jgi:hypothetical protein